MATIGRTFFIVLMVWVLAGEMWGMTFPGGGRPVRGAKRQEVLERLLEKAEGEALVAVLREPMQVREWVLSCYPVRLYGVEGQGHGTSLWAYALVGEGSVQFLNGRPELFYALNDQGLLSIETEAQVREYVQLFINALGNEEGRSYLMEDVDDVAWFSAPGSESSVRECRLSVAEKLIPFSASRRSEGGWSIETRVMQKSNFCEAELELEPNGDLLFKRVYSRISGVYTQRSFFENGLYQRAVHEEETRTAPNVSRDRELLEGTLFPALQAAWERFPLVDIRDEKWYGAKGGMAPVMIEGHAFTGFRFRYEPEKGRDFVWAFSSRGAESIWYIIPREGEMKGFFNENFGPTLYLEKRKIMTTQTLGRECFQPGQEYLIWFQLRWFREADLRFSIRLRDLKPGANPGERDQHGGRFDDTSIMEAFAFRSCGDLGMRINESTGEVENVMLGLAAEEAGIQPGDIVLGMADAPEPAKKRRERIARAGGRKSPPGKYTEVAIKWDRKRHGFSFRKKRTFTLRRERYEAVAEPGPLHSLPRMP